MMAESPRKRQRLSTDTYRSASDRAQGDTSEVHHPVTPTKRASYLSPTKASLARSHPDILAKSPKRGSLTEPRGKLLRQELLGSRKNAQELSAPKSAPRHIHNAQLDPTDSSVAEKDGFAEAIAQSFPPLPRSVPPQSAQSAKTQRSPLSPRRPPNATVDFPSRKSRRDSMSLNGMPVPKLIPREDFSVRQPSLARTEPELPPTPVQLGIDAAPDRPRGLASSSSLGSKSGSGSGRRRRRVRRNGTAATSSPLKPRNNRPLSPTDFSDVEEAENIMAEEAAESDAEETTKESSRKVDQVVDIAPNLDPDELPIEIREKQLELISLRSELERMQGAFTSIEQLTDQLQRGSGLEMDEATLDLLNIEPASSSIELQPPDTHPSFLVNPSAYLNLFAPGNIHLQHETSAMILQARSKVVHILKAAPPSPWHANLLHLALEVQVDAENARIDKVNKPDHLSRSAHHNLDQWIQSRLESPLHKLDVGGLIWGFGQYCKACTTRAKVLRYLQRRYNENSAPASLPNLEDNTDVSSEDVPELARYFAQTQLRISPPGSRDLSTRRKPTTRLDPKSKQILLVYQIELSWTGEATVAVEVSLAGVNGKAQVSVKELFVKLVPSLGVIGAFEGVWDVLGWGGQSDGGVSTTTVAAAAAGTSKKAGKSRR